MTAIAPARLEEIVALLTPTHFTDAQLQPLAGDASFRRYIRVSKGDKSAMLMDAPPDKEDVRPFVSVAEYLVEQGYSAPSILARNVPAGLLLLEDLGDHSFSAVLQRDTLQQSELYEAAIDVLAQWHDKTRGFSHAHALPLPVYDSALLMREVALFTDWFLPQVLGPQQAAALAPEYLALWQEIIAGAPLARDLFVHRDYHADNLMWLPHRPAAGRVGLLDFQDAVYGDGAYDLVSLLEDARRDVSPELADAMLARYIKMSGADAEKTRLAYAILGAQRNSKIVGIFARLAVRDHKLGYLNFLPRVWAHLEHDLAHPSLRPLKLWLDKHVGKQFRGRIDIKPLH